MAFPHLGVIHLQGKTLLYLWNQGVVVTFWGLFWGGGEGGSFGDLCCWVNLSGQGAMERWAQIGRCQHIPPLPASKPTAHQYQNKRNGMVGTSAAHHGKHCQFSMKTQGQPSQATLGNIHGAWLFWMVPSHWTILFYPIHHSKQWGWVLGLLPKQVACYTKTSINRDIAPAIKDESLRGVGASDFSLSSTPAEGVRRRQHHWESTWAVLASKENIGTFHEATLGNFICRWKCLTASQETAPAWARDTLVEGGSAPQAEFIFLAEVIKLSLSKHLLAQL